MIYGTHATHVGDYGTLDDLAATVKDAIAHIRPYLGEFDSIACLGISGVVVAVPVALALDVPVCIVRKPGDGCHSISDKLWVNRKRLGARVLWIDDRIATGTTKHNVIEACIAASATLIYEYLYENEIDGVQEA